MPKGDVIHQRPKRLAFLSAGIIAVLAVAITTIIGLTTHALVQNKGLKEDLQSLQTRQQELVEKLAP
jgi:phosphopantetheine adenylyltransferase